MRAPFTLAPVLLWIALLLAPGPALARTPQVMLSVPAAESVVDGHNMRFIVRFDGPVDHLGSRLEIRQGGTVIRTMRALLDSAPNVLFGGGMTLPPGDYTLHWSVAGGVYSEPAEGDIPFTIRP